MFKKISKLIYYFLFNSRLAPPGDMYGRGPYRDDYRGPSRRPFHRDGRPGGRMNPNDENRPG
jgi:hypothetical protein